MILTIGINDLRVRRDSSDRDLFGTQGPIAKSLCVGEADLLDDGGLVEAGSCCGGTGVLDEEDFFCWGVPFDVFVNCGSKFK